MPVADFAGRFGWGYDGVNLYAPTRLYGTPDDLRAFVDRAHALGIGVILDVVYNHLGPDGNYLAEFSRDYFTDATRTTGARRSTSKDRAAGARVLRRERRLLDRRVPFRRAAPRRDAGHPRRLARARHRRTDPAGAREAAGSRAIYVVAENEPQDTRLVRDPAHGRLRPRRALERRLPSHRARRADRPARGLLLRLPGLAAGAHLVREVRLSLSGAVVPLAEEAPRHAGARPAAARVRHLSRESRPGRELRAFGRRLHQLSLAGAPARADRADAARSGDADAVPGAGVRLVGAVPVFRRSQGGAARSRCREGRREFLAQFPSLRDPEVQATLPSPVDEATFERCKLDLAERERHAALATRCTAICSRCAATDPVIAARRAGASTAR